MTINLKTTLAAVVCAAALIAAGRYSSFLNITVSISGQNGNAVAAEPAKPAGEKEEAGKPAAAGEPATVELNEKQLGQIKIEPASRQTFLLQKSMVGNIDFNEDLLVQVFTPYQGRLVTVEGKIGDPVKAGQVLFTIDSYDLLQAESTLVQAAGVFELTSKALARAQKLLPAGGGAQKDLDQAVSDQQTAEGNLKAARNALYIYGKTDADIAKIESDRKVDSTLVVKSPIDGVITARNASPGLFVQPGNAPAPFTVANTAVKWMLASVTEADSPLLKVGDTVKAQLLAFPGKTFEGKVTALGQTIDPATRRNMVRAEIKDPENVLRSGMFATFTITTGAPRLSVALPTSGLVREGDGTVTAWTTKDKRHFTQLVVKVGLEQNGYREILEGVTEGDLMVTDGAVFVSNILNAPPSD
jgi:cobalt-zinc-cadmium efflux system membrane fusion protein